MNIAEINILDSGSTGKIMLQIAELARKKGHFVITMSKGWNAFSRYKLLEEVPNHYYINNFISSALHYKLGVYLGLNGFFSFFATLRLIHILKKNKINLIHLHNIHNFCFNLPLLFGFIKKHGIPVVWTLHDCWGFTGRCPYFVLTKCDKWKNGCHDCPYPSKAYPAAYNDTSRMMWKLKRNWFMGISNAILITPSRWLADLVKQSYLGKYPIKTINNGINLSIFRPRNSDFRERYELQGKKLVLGVAFDWNNRKGLDVFIELSRSLPGEYKIILVGTNARVDLLLPKEIISIHRTQNQEELAEIYTAVDVFANPTREEVLGLVNIESLACGTPVVTFKTGGSPECIDETCGSVVECDDINAMKSEILRICEEKPYSEKACLKYAKLFDMKKKFEEYISVYEKIGKDL